MIEKDELITALGGTEDPNGEQVKCGDTTHIIGGRAQYGLRESIINDTFDSYNILEDNAGIDNVIGGSDNTADLLQMDYNQRIVYLIKKYDLQADLNTAKSILFEKLNVSNIEEAIEALKKKAIEVPNVEDVDLGYTVDGRPLESFEEKTREPIDIEKQMQPVMCKLENYYGELTKNIYLIIDKACI